MTNLCVKLYSVLCHSKIRAMKYRLRLHGILSALRRPISLWHQSTARLIREHMEHTGLTKLYQKGAVLSTDIRYVYTEFNDTNMRFTEMSMISSIWVCSGFKSCCLTLRILVYVIWIFLNLKKTLWFCTWIPALILQTTFNARFVSSGRSGNLQSTADGTES